MKKQEKTLLLCILFVGIVCVVIFGTNKSNSSSSNNSQLKANSCGRVMGSLIGLFTGDEKAQPVNARVFSKCKDFLRSHRRDFGRGISSKLKFDREK